MAARSSTDLSRLSPVAYVVAAVILLFVVSDLIAVTWPFVPSQVSWRYGVIGLVSGTLYYPLLAMLVLLVAGASADNRLVIILTTVMSTLAGILLVAMLGIFLLDVSELRTLAQQGQNAGGFDRAGFQAILKLSVSALTFLFMALVGFRLMSATKRAKSDAGPSIVASQSRS